MTTTALPPEQIKANEAAAMNTEYLGDTGQGALLTLEDTGIIGCVRSMQLPEWVMEKIDASCLDTTGFMKYIPGDLVDPGEIVAEIIFDATVPVPVPDGVVETVTVEFPLGRAVNTTKAKLTGSAFITISGLPNMAINELMVLNITIAFDGGTGPIFTPESA